VRQPAGGERALRCAGCGAGLLVEAGRAFEVVRYPHAVEAADVAGHLAAALRARQAPAKERLIEVHYLELPYWRTGPAELVAAWPCWIDAARRVALPPGDPRPAVLDSPPLVAASAQPSVPEQLVMLPVYDVRYQVRGRSFHALVEACSGRVLADLWPHPWTVRVHVAMAAVLILDVAAFAAAAYLAPNNLVRTVAVATLGLPVYALTAAAFRLREK
jgi:hypothetical protein